MSETIQIIVEGKDNASKAFGAVNKSLDSLDKGAVKAHSRLGDLGGGILKLGAIATGAGVLALGALAGAAVSAATGFEQTISGIKAVSGATAQEAKEISSLALQLGKDTAFSAKEAAAGIEELIKGGLNIPDVMNGAAKSMLDLAAAGGVSIPDAAEIAANAMAMFNLKGDQMAHAADLIAGAANASSLSVTDFKFSMAASGAIAATTGQTFDDLAQAIAIMGKSGIKGSDAGTSLKTMLMNLQPTTKKAKETFKELGITMADGTNQFIRADGSFKSMAEIAGVLQEATKGLTDAQKLQALETMFGSDAIRAAAIFAKEGATGFDAMASSMGKVTAASVGAERLNNLAGSMEQLKGSLETAAIALGMALLPMIRKVVDAFTQLVNAALPLIEQMGPMLVASIDQAQAAFASLMPTIQPLIDIIQANLQPILIGLGAVIAAVLVPALWAAGVALAAAVVSLVSVLAPLAAVGAAVYLLYRAWETNFLGIQDIVYAVLGAVVPFVRRMVSIITDWWLENMPLIQKTVETVMNAVEAVITAVLTFVTDFWRDHGEQIVAIVRAMWRIISTVIETTIRNILDILRVVMQLITGDWEGAWDTIKVIGQRTWDAILVIVGAALDILVNILALAWDAIKVAAEAAWNALTDFIRQKVDEQTAILRAFLSPIQGVIDAIGNLLGIIGRIPSSISLPSIPSFSFPSFSLPSFGGGDTFAGQSQDVQASFIGSYGAAAADVWQAEHDAARGYQHGGSFVVGGQPGIDRNLVSMLLTKGETVDITPAGRAGAGRGINITVTGNTMIGSETSIARELARLLKPELDRVTEMGW